jgi:hypothetical protein
LGTDVGGKHNQNSTKDPFFGKRRNFNEFGDPDSFKGVFRMLPVRETESLEVWRSI